MILLYSHTSDPLTKAILDNEALKNKVTPVSIQNFMDECQVHDSIINQKINVSWKIPGKLEITNQSKQKIVNRIVNIPDELFNDFHEEDREYAKTEYIAYFNFSLHQFQNILGKPGQYGIMGNQYPLNVQWEIARSKGYTVPNYFWGEHQYLPQMSTNALITSRSLTQFYNWKKNYSELTFSEKEDWLFYERPAGIPVLIYGFLGNHHHEYPSFSQVLSDEEVFILYRESEKIAANFEFPIYEMLLFYDTAFGKVEFGMINSVFQGVRNQGAFRNFVTKAIQSEENL